MNYSKNWTDEEFINAIQNSTSKRQVLIKLGLVPIGGNYGTITRNVERLNLDISHFTGKGWSRDKNLGPKRSLEDYLSNKFPITTWRLKMRLIEEGIFQWVCSNCQRTKWLDEKIPLELEHKDGNKYNNNLSNLCLLCPNCHALTPTYRGRNASKSKAI